MRARATIGVVAFVLLPAAAAPALTVQQRPGGRVDEEPVNLVRITGAPGESSNLDVTVRRSGPDRQGSPTVVRVHDPQGGLHAGRGCVLAGTRTVFCRGADELGELSLALGDGDDRASVRSISRDQFIFIAVIDGGPGADRLSTNDGTELRGGPGDDVLIGSARYETMDGGPGNDVLRGNGHGDFLAGGPGDDVLVGGAGNDDLIGGSAEAGGAPAGTDRLIGGSGDDTLDDADADAAPPVIGPDVLAGGPGEDEISSYLRRTRPVTLDLRSGGPAGERGEGDTVTSVERLFGGSAGDVIVGGPARDFIDGRAGDDRVDGGAGDDFVFAADGDDTRCGAGSDRARLDPDPGARDRPGPLVASDCELLASGTGIVLRPSPALDASDRLRFRVARAPHDAVRLEVTDAAAPFGRLGTSPLATPEVAIGIPAPSAQAIREQHLLVRARMLDPMGWLVWRSAVR